MSLTLSTPSAPTGFQFRPAELVGLVGVSDQGKVRKLSVLSRELCTRGCPYQNTRIAVGQSVVAVRRDGNLYFANPHEANGEALESKQEVIQAFRALLY